jgi:acetyltransferase-like isoleucine patch superfamily enzyme
VPTVNAPSPVSYERRRALLARARAELELRRLRALGHSIRTGEGPLFYDALPRLSAAGGEISIGDGFSTYSRPIRVQVTAAAGGRVAIGNGVGINYGVDIYAARSVEIGDDTMIGTMVSIYDTNFHPIGEGDPTVTTPVRIGSNVWLGRGAIVLPGVEIGDYAVVAAGAVVTADVPPRTIVAGSPAKQVRELRASEGWRRNSDPG